MRRCIWRSFQSAEEVLPSVLIYLPTALLFQAMSKYLLLCPRLQEAHLPSCINLEMFHFCKSGAVIFAFLGVPFIWCTQCVVQMLCCQTWLPPNLLCDPWLVAVPPGKTTSLPAAKYTDKNPQGAPLSIFLSLVASLHGLPPSSHLC